MYNLFGKRLFDIVFSFLALILLTPIFLVLMLLIYFSIGTPIIFQQKRVGHKGIEFYVFKFRTMKGQATHGQLWSAEEEISRTTIMSRFMRKHCIDELPQFFNVLRGDMSVVGPRPRQKSEYRPAEIGLTKTLATVLRVRPGITGVNQIAFRKEEFSNPEKRIECLKRNSRYVKEMSFFGDLSIMLKTVLVMFKGH